MTDTELLKRAREQLKESEAMITLLCERIDFLHADRKLLRKQVRKLKTLFERVQLIQMRQSA